jgi:hypothetical protein
VPVGRPQTSSRERALRCALALAGSAAGVAFAAQIFVMLRARHELTQVESIVGIHARMLAAGEGLYYDLQQYPFTVSPYGPLFYSLSAGLQQMGLPVLPAGRLITLTALVLVVLLCWRLLMLYTADRAASVAGTLLLASTANLLQWGTIGQVDMLALCFSLAALLQFSYFDRTGKLAPLMGSGACIALAVFTKQSFVAAGAAIALLVLLKNRRRGVCFTACLAVGGLALAAALNSFTAGRFFDNTVLANLNPFSAQKIWRHLQYFLPAAGSLLLLAAAGWKAAPSGRFHPFHVYLAAAAGVMALTAPKVGSDLNYQLETMTVLCLCAGWSLHRLEFFPLWLRRDTGWVTLLEIPLLLHLALNVSLTAKAVLERGWLQDLRRQEAAALRPYLGRARGPVLSVQIDPLLQNGLRMEVEPLIYTLLVDAGVVDPEPLRRDLANGRFALVLLYENLFVAAAPANSRRNPEVPSLPESHLREIRQNYRLVGHVAGPLLGGDYLYEPIKHSRARPPQRSSTGVEVDYSQRPIAAHSPRP